MVEDGAGRPLKCREAGILQRDVDVCFQEQGHFTRADTQSHVRSDGIDFDQLAEQRVANAVFVCLPECNADVPLVPLFVFTFGTALGLPHDEVLAYYSRPFPAIIAGLSILLGMVHFKNGAQSMIEDYWQGLTRKAALIGMTSLCYTAAAVGLFAIVRIAL